MIELSELVLKNNIFECSDKTYKEICRMAIGTKFAQPYAVLFMAALQEKILNKIKKKPNVWWGYIYYIFFIWEHGEELLKEFLNESNSFLRHSSLGPILCTILQPPIFNFSDCLPLWEVFKIYSLPLKKGGVQTMKPLAKHLKFNVR